MAWHLIRVVGVPVVFLILSFSRIPREEAVLCERFGGHYPAYCLECALVVNISNKKLE